MNLDDLKKPFPPETVQWRVGSITSDKSRGLALAYIDARDVMERLDTVCGISGWQCRYTHAGNIVICEIGIRIDNEWVWKADGAGATDVEAQKGACSDALKRAAVRWGVGRYLYDIKSPWVALEARGRSYVISKSEMGLLLRVLSGESSAQEAPPKSNGKTFWDLENLYLPVPKDSNGDLDFKKWAHAETGYIARVKKAPDQNRLHKLESHNQDTRMYLERNLGGLWNDVYRAEIFRSKALQSTLEAE